jgi:hypothetical protein
LASGMGVGACCASEEGRLPCCGTTRKGQTPGPAPSGAGLARP